MQNVIFSPLTTVLRANAYMFISTIQDDAAAFRRQCFYASHQFVKARKFKRDKLVGILQKTSKGSTHFCIVSYRLSIMNEIPMLVIIPRWCSFVDRFLSFLRRTWAILWKPIKVKKEFGLKYCWSLQLYMINEFKIIWCIASVLSKARTYQVVNWFVFTEEVPDAVKPTPCKLIHRQP